MLHLCVPEGMCCEHVRIQCSADTENSCPHHEDKVTRQQITASRARRQADALTIHERPELCLRLHRCQVPHPACRARA